MQVTVIVLSRKRCLGGLIDTDGCMHVDKHTIKHRIYKNIGLNFTNYSVPLLDFVYESLKSCGFHPTRNTSHSVCLRKEKEIVQYMECVGTSNEKIRLIFQGYVQEKSEQKSKRKSRLELKQGRVPKRS